MQDQTTSADSGVSGKLVIITILIAAVGAALGGWVFRYNATHRAVEFWGPEAALAIRDAKKVSLTQVSRDKEGYRLASFTVEVSDAPGLMHLRAALLEDRSFEWPAEEEDNVSPFGNDIPFGWELKFARDTTRNVTVYFSPDFKRAYNFLDGRRCRHVSCAPIAAGLKQVLIEMFDISKQ